MPQHPVRIETKSLPKPWPGAPGLSRRAARVTLDLAADRWRKNAEYEFVRHKQAKDKIVNFEVESRTEEAAQRRDYGSDTFDSRVYEEASVGGGPAKGGFGGSARLQYEEVPGGSGLKKALGNDGPVFYSFGEVASNGDRESHVSDAESTDGTEDERLERVHSPYVQEEAMATGSQHSPTAYHVTESRYAGDGYADGHHSAKLTAILSERTAVSRSMFRWIHFTRSSMDIDDFSAQIALIPGLSSIETAGLQDMLTSIKRDYATTVQVSDGKYVRCLEPGLRHDSLTLDGKVLGSRSVTWISLPYFSLEPYSGLLSGSSTKGFPTPTLLQAKYPRTIRSRDMEQAVCQQKGVPNGSCFHVSQLWCLILDNTLLLTYGRLTEKALCEDIITKDIKPLPISSAAMTDKKLLVRYQGTMMWSIPVQQCQTWFSFVSHFRNYQPRRLRFFYSSTLVQPKKWHKFYRLAVHPDKTLILDIHLSSPVKLPDSEVLLSSSVGDEAVHSAQQATGSAAQFWEQEGSSSVHLAPLPAKGDFAPAASQTRRPGAETKTPFGIFAYLDLSKRFGKGSTTAPVRLTSSEENNLKEYFDEIQDYIRTKTLPGDRHAYNSVKGLKRSAVHELLDIERQVFYEEYPPGYQRDFDRRVSFFYAAEALFDFFFPKNTLVATTRRFWGAVGHLVSRVRPKLRDTDTATSAWEKDNKEIILPVWQGRLQFLAEILEGLRADILAFGENFANIEDSDLESLKTPVIMTNAWVHITLALTTFPSDYGRSLELAKRAAHQIHAGMKEIIAARSDSLGIQDLVVLPSDLVALMSLKLTSNAGPNKLDIFSIYGSYLNIIDYDIATKPPDRKIDHELSLLDQELSIIDWILELQIQIINQFLVTREHLSSVSKETFGEANEVDQGELPDAYNVPQPVRWVHESPSQQTTLASMAESILAQSSNRRPPGFSYLLLDHCVKELYRKQRDVQGISDAAANMSVTNRTRINQTKDRQERAIYAFTMVTVIFLPLSAVASIFGMNSSDIRDMDLGQWAYWATAVPVTAVVMLLGLLVTGELGNAWWWLEQRVGAWLGRRSALQSLRRARDRRERRAQREEEGSEASTFDDESI